MGLNVFANGREISAKKDGNKSIASMPDVALSPPSPPAGPVPVPYPNTAKASDTSSGSKKVKIGGKEIGLKNKSQYKKSNGDEAATKSLGMGVVSHNIQGPLKHAAWSMNVKIEGKNAIRHMDMTTQNHINQTNACPGIDIGSQQPPTGDPECVALEIQARDAVGQDTADGKLPYNDALVTAKTSDGRTFKAVQPGSDWVRSGAEDGYSQPHVQEEHPCNGKPHSTNPQGNKDHSECKIMHDAFPAKGKPPPGTSITMRINWNNKGKLSHSPCTQCMGSICETAMECEIDIYICEADDKGELKKNKVECKKQKHKKPNKYGRTYSNKWKGTTWS